MVAITVILAAVIAAFVFGMASGVSKTKAVAATARQMQNDVIITWQGGQDNAQASGYNITVTNATQSWTKSLSQSPPIVGNTTAFPGAGTSGQDHVVVIASFSDGSMQVVLDTYV
jgi:FlaG/FlaF family flagellin (archaellin)